MVVPNFGKLNFLRNFRGLNIGETNIMHNIIVYIWWIAQGVAYVTGYNSNT